MVDKTSSVPLYIQIRDLLHDQIRSGELAPGAQVPSELELVAQYNVSRMTARKALDELVKAGLLFRQRGKGTFVTQDLVTYSLSTMLSFSGTLRALGYQVETRVLHQDVILASAGVAEKLDLAPESEAILVRRLRYVDGKPAAIHTSFLDYRVYAPLLKIDLSQESLLESIERLCGTHVAYTKDSVQATLVSGEDMGLLEIPRGSPVLDVEGVAFTEFGQPTRLTKAIYRSDLFRLVVTNRGDPAGTALKMTNLPEGTSQDGRP